MGIGGRNSGPWDHWSRKIFLGQQNENQKKILEFPLFKRLGNVPIDSLI
jgi:hypothetical protein